MAVTNEELMASVEGITVPDRFLETVATSPDAVALRWKNDDGSWGELTYSGYAERVSRAVAGYKMLGLEPGMCVLLMMRNIPEFHILDMAAYFCGATPVSIYNSSSSEQVHYLASHCDAHAAIVEDVGFLERFLAVRADLPALQSMAIIRDEAGLAPDDVVHYEELLDNSSVDLAEAARSCDPDQLATMIYTSGTTGPPKAVMLSHRNIVWTAESLRLAINFESFLGKRVVSYLPMAHIAERMVSHYLSSSVACEVTTCPDPKLIADYAREARPNLMFGVPRVWEKIYSAVNGAVAADPEKQRQFDEAIEAAKPIAEKMAWDQASDDELATWNFLDEVAFEGVRQLIGLDACEMAISGAAPINPDVLRWYRAIGVPMSEVYGLSETSGPMTWTPWRIKPGTIGPAIPGCEVKIADDGEIVCRGGNVFLGYFRDEAKTAEVMDADGWFHSGDIGVVDDDGYFSVVDRKKELIITAGGKNISPANLEIALKSIPLIGQAAAVGDRRPFVAAIVTLDPDVAPAWATTHGIEFESLDELARNPRVIEEIERQLAEVMKPFSNAERVKKVCILGEEWLPDSDVLTPTSKLKRRGILNRYNDQIEQLYGI